jgi:hypothetical protein
MICNKHLKVLINTGNQLEAGPYTGGGGGVCFRATAPLEKTIFTIFRLVDQDETCQMLLMNIKVSLKHRQYFISDCSCL